MPQKSKTLSYTKKGLRFTWEGGEYIDVYFVGLNIPFETINTSDNDLPFTMESLKKQADEWLVDFDAGDYR